MSHIFQKLSCIFIVCVLFAFTPANELFAKSNPSKKGKRSRVNDENPQLLADKVTIKRDLHMADSLMLVKEIEGEDLLFPADELYGSWNTQRVNPYSKDQIVTPDSFVVDLTSFVMPIEGRVTSNYGPRRRRMHYGTDLKLEVGDTVRAAFEGRVRVKYYQRRGYGYYMVIRHPNGLETVYGHLSRFLVDSEEIVKAGQPIALGGNTGRSTGPHLHFEIRFLGQPINPAKIVDFNNFVTHEDYYVFNGNKENKVEEVDNKYTAKSKSVPKVVYHRVKNGDTLGGIAAKYRLSVKQLCRINNIKSSATLRIGQSIRCS